MPYNRVLKIDSSFVVSWCSDIVEEPAVLIILSCTSLRIILDLIDDLLSKEEEAEEEEEE